MKRKLFCEFGPICYQISLRKERIKRNIKDFFSKDMIAHDKTDVDLKYLIKSHYSPIERKLTGVNPVLQKSKRINIEIASSKINKLIIHPNEVFSFWKIVGEPSYQNGYREGLVITNHGFKSGIGGGLCQMANMVHWLVLNSPLEVIELHHHTDALFPDADRRIPFGTGTSVAFNNIDYRFRNNTDADIELLTWCKDGVLMGEIRSSIEFPYHYRIVEEGNYFVKEKEDYYRISKVYQLVIYKRNDKIIAKNLVLDNHSKVMYDHELIPKEQIKDVR